MAWLQWIAEVVGPILLIVLLIWFTLRGRRSEQGLDRAERGARELREQLAREDENRL